MSITLKRILHVGKFLFPFFILVIVAIEARKELATLSIRNAVHVIKNIPTGGFFLAITVSILAVSMMFFYDFLMIRSMKIDITIRKIFRVSWIANSFNGIFGFGGLVGAGLRVMLYRSYVQDNGKLVKNIAWMTTAFITGLSFLSFLGLIGVLNIGFLLQEKPWLWPALLIFAFLVPVYIGISKVKRKKEKDREGKASTAVLYSLVSLVEWLSASIVMYVIVLLLGIEMSFRQTLGVYVISAIAGSISLVPGGIGSFDLIFLMGLKQYGISAETTLSVLLLYRLVYTLFPFGIGLAFAAFEMTGLTLKKIEDRPFIAPTLETTGVLWALRRRFFSTLSSWSLATLTALTGCIIILSVLLPTAANRAHELRILVPKQLIQISFGLSLSFGVLLILLTKGVYHQTKRSYYMICFVLIGGAVFNALKGIDLEETFLLLIILAVFYALRTRFVKERIELTLVDVGKAIVTLLVILYIYDSLGTWISEITNTFEPHYVVRTTDQVHRSTLLTAIVVPVFLLGGLLSFKRSRTKMVGQPASSVSLQNFLEKYGGNVLSHLGFLGDKRFFFSSDGQALIQFTRSGDRLVVLGDPSGNSLSFSKAVAEFLHEADQFGYTCIFYQIESKWMGLYHDFGYNFFKLGEEAIVDVNTFTLSGKKRASLRATVNKFKREGYVFSVIPPPFTNELYTQLKGVSDAWLNGKKEKGFSLGYFSLDYINRAPVAILADKDGYIVAFYTLMPVYQPNEISIDLMRYIPNAPSGVMDAMLIHLLEWAKQEGYLYLNIGMAPLSNVGISPHSFWYERVAAAIFNNVRYMYSFNGLRFFKDKYKPVWNGKYLAYRKTRSLPSTMLVVTRLIGKRKKQ
ncbi:MULTISPECIES: bifunctional lysylphosphatidylglycerol flippase/synthetase MprF [Priestia]|uniref:bifunctional lysylphosphatidylglycerol flippase/synthetase MprF n=1 Tax=Priestia TaxID=2800373 RepID=UPI000E2ECDB9|nr:bifunctional lysylphosphatidylglycerol flippase/synthetase MprF [Priestia megaterium]MDC7783121.1 bifunctional lysylphosphatidylglycerol flippase/synthetase MprF [Priestia megaterium]MDN3232901.1 bifunctional lysylphosphatidylglycerol flippase/synthetase MprF [Priestia megaterium]RFB20526.1 bifunctional lysylphosphatidylglycerol flippase/synthetase MprF [Bacillus sp. ALD]